MSKLKLGFKLNGLTLRFPESVPVGSSPASRAEAKAARTEAAKKLALRSEETRFRALIKKHGLEAACNFDVPIELVEAERRAEAKRAKAAAKKARRRV